MSREIKVRLYSKPAKRYIDYITVGFLNTGELRSYSTENGMGPVLDDSYIVEQYTGLKDKNGKEIYEGDIVQIPDDWEEYGVAAGQRYEVYFAYGGFRCKPLGFAEIRGDKGYWIEDSEDFEVIGNIHENPELLEKAK